jgi:hypothetical protein
LHWRRQEQKGITGGQAFKTLEEVLGFIQWANAKGKAHVADLYYCTSLQKEHGDLKPNKRFAAERSIDNAVSSRLLFADIDKYASKDEAVRAVKAFCDASQSPYPTALVDSGGGIHAYWILPEPLEKDAWLELACKFDGLLTAHDLKHDNISTDMARILRPPETFNYKRVKDGLPPQPVVLKLLNSNVDLEVWKSLHTATPAIQPAKLVKPGNFALTPVEELFLDPKLAEGGPAPAFAQRIPLEERISQGSLDPAPVLKFCPMFGEGIKTGGEKVGQPVWHQQALACTFFVGGRDIFHDLGCKHPGYSRETSDGMFDRKLRDRHNKSLGYPSCAVFEADGCTECKTCPLKGKVVSPLNINERKVLDMMLGAAVDVVPVREEIDKAIVKDIIDAGMLKDNMPPPPDWHPLLPPFSYDDRGAIWYKPKRGAPEPIMMSPVFSAQLVKDEKGSGIGMRVICASDFGARVEVILPSEAFSNNSDVHKHVNAGGAATMANPTLTTKLMCSIRGQLMYEAKAQRAVPFGWVFEDRVEGKADQGEPIGFSFGGKVYYADGRTESTYGGDARLLDTYCVTGVADPWFEALKVILDTKSAGLQCLTLAGFAAPLMYLTGQYGTAFMAMGESGGSKSSAVAVGVAAWARHKSAMLKPTTSSLALMKRMGKIRHLVTVWDDIQNEHFEQIKPTLIQITQGSEGLKLDQSRREREEGEWESLVVTTSNASLAEFLEQNNKNDSSGLVRCFEICLPGINKGDAGYVENDKMAPLFASLNSNHGHVGREYAKMLGRDPAGIKRLLEAMGKRIKDQIEPYEIKERYWLAGAQVLLTAAHLANQLLSMINKSPHQDLQFDAPYIEAFLVSTFKSMRRRTMEAKVNANKSQYAKTHLANFFNDYAAPKEQMLWSQEMPRGPGRPSDACAPIFPLGMELKHMKRVTVRWLTTDRIVRVSKSALETYLRSVKVSPVQVINGLKLFYSARIVDRVTLAGGVPDISGGAAPEQVIEIDVEPASWMELMLDRHARRDDPQGNAPEPLPQTPGQPAPRPPLEHRAREGAKDAS